MNLLRLSIALLVGVLGCSWPGWASGQALAGGARLSGGYVAPELAGRKIEEVRILGARQVPESMVRNVLRTQAGEAFVPATVSDDYRRIFNLGRFSSVRAHVEPTDTGVVVTFIVSEPRQVADVAFVGNRNIESEVLRETAGIEVAQGIDTYRLSVARRALRDFYVRRNYPFAEVTLDEAALRDAGRVVFLIAEGPRVRVRRVAFAGNFSVTGDRLLDQVRTRYWIPILREGTLDLDMLESDVGALRQYYEGLGFFDVRVGRTLAFNFDRSEVQVTFVIDEGPRYKVAKLSFEGMVSLSEPEVRAALRMTEGRTFDRQMEQRDLRAVIRAYGPLGFIHDPQSDNPEYLRVSVRRVFQKEPGSVELVYVVREGKPFRLGRIIVKGNSRSQDKLVMREFRMQPGEMYNTGLVQDALDRLRSTPYFSRIDVTPIGSDPNYRDLLVEVGQRRTANISVGGGVSSSGGVSGNLTFEQTNYDISAWPSSWEDIENERAFVGAGQSLRLSIEPGTEVAGASIRFTEPWVFDLPFSLTGEAYLRNRFRPDWDEQRVGGRVNLGHRIGNDWGVSLNLRGEDVQIRSIQDKAVRGQDILDVAGHNTITSIGLTVRRNTTDRVVVPSMGSNSAFNWEAAGAMGGEYHFQKLNLETTHYITVYEDLLDRKTTVRLTAEAGYIEGDAPFFERFYAGGMGSVRGFAPRGISPRQGLDDDSVGGYFTLTGTAELNFPLYGDNLRGVLFVDVGTVEEKLEITKIRSSVGFGFRLLIPALGPVPLAFDLGFPITQDDKDNVRFLSFSLGVGR